MTYKNTDNSFTTKFENSTTLQKGADLSGNMPLFLLVSFDPIVCILKRHWSVNQKGRFPLFSINFVIG